MTEEQLNALIVELQHTIRGLRHEVAGANATTALWEEMYKTEKAKRIALER